MIETVNFELGEKKYVCICVRSADRHVFEVTSAKYVLKKGDEVEASGQCEIAQVSDSEVTLTALIQPMAKSATYVLEYTYEIPPEVLIHDIRVAVS